MDLRCCWFLNSRTRPEAASRALEGTQPRFTQVPPMSWPSMTATLRPCGYSQATVKCRVSLQLSCARPLAWVWHASWCCCSVDLVLVTQGTAKASGVRCAAACLLPRPAAAGWVGCHVLLPIVPERLCRATCPAPCVCTPCASHMPLRKTHPAHDCTLCCATLLLHAWHFKYCPMGAKAMCLSRPWSRMRPGQCATSGWPSNACCQTSRPSCLAAAGSPLRCAVSSTEAQGSPSEQRTHLLHGVQGSTVATHAAADDDQVIAATSMKSCSSQLGPFPQTRPKFPQACGIRASCRQFYSHLLILLVCGLSNHSGAQGPGADRGGSRPARRARCVHKTHF